MFFLPTVEISNCCTGSGIPNQIFLRRLGQHNCTEDEIKKAADSSKYISWIDMGGLVEFRHNQRGELPESKLKFPEFSIIFHDSAMNARIKFGKL